MVATRSKRKNSKEEKSVEKITEKVDSMDVDDKQESEKKPETKSLEQITLVDVIQHCRHIERFVTTREYRSMGRVIRELNTIRKQLTPAILKLCIASFVDNEKCPLAKFLPATESNLVYPEDFNKLAYCPENDIYIHLLLVIWLFDQAKSSNSSELLGDCIEAANVLVTRLSEWSDRGGIDQFQARAYFFQAQALESAGMSLQSCVAFWHQHIRTAILRSHTHSQAILYNLLLRTYLDNQQYDQADKFMHKTDFPKSADNNQWARYYYYTGKVKVVQLEYSDARQRLVQALRKSPTNEETAVGFKQTVAKLLTTVQLLLGEIPERSIFFKPTLKMALHPYYELTQSVRSGDLAKFSIVVKKYAKSFEADKNLKIIMRLRHNVIKTGIRQIAMSYSKISLTDLSMKLHLDNADDAEFIVAKAIKDGVIEAEIDHSNRWVISHNSDNTYSTRDPQDIFQKRIDFCFDIHRQSILSMRYPDKDNRLDGLLNADQIREREKEETELIDELADETDDDDDMM